MNKKTELSFHKPAVKFISAFATAFTLPIFSGIFEYISLSEKSTFLSNFGYEFTITMIINLTLVCFIILPLSIWVEGSIVRKQNPNLVNVISHISIGIFSGVIYSLFIPSTTPLGPIFYGVLLAIIFFIYQLVFIWFLKRANNVS